MSKHRAPALVAALLSEIDTLEHTAERVDRAAKTGSLAALKAALAEAEALLARYGAPQPALTAEQQARLVIVPQRRAS